MHWITKADPSDFVETLKSHNKICQYQILLKKFKTSKYLLSLSLLSFSSLFSFLFKFESLNQKKNKEVKHSYCTHIFTYSYNKAQPTVKSKSKKSLLRKLSLFCVFKHDSHFVTL